jgi:hypothetical protein
VREQVRPVAADLAHEPVLAATAEQVPDQGDGQQLGVGAGRGGPGTARDDQDPALDRVIDQAVDVDEQQLSCQHGGGSCGGGNCDNCLLPQESLRVKHRAGMPAGSAGGHLDLPGDGHEGAAVAITEGDRFSGRRAADPRRSGRN